MTDVRPRPRRVAIDGFTLTEMLIVVTMMGLLAATLAAVFTVIVRTTPDSQQRITDARSLKGLVTWVPQDMDATPPGGFRDSPTEWPCSGLAPAESYNIIAMAWTEKADVTTEFDASYRYEHIGDEWIIARYSCQDSGVARRSQHDQRAACVELDVTARLGGDVQHHRRRSDGRLPEREPCVRSDHAAGRVDEDDAHAARRHSVHDRHGPRRTPTRIWRTTPTP